MPVAPPPGPVRVGGAPQGGGGVKLIDQLSRVGHGIAMAMMMALLAVMMIEVVARYALRAPTLWAADMTYMLNGAMFMLAAGWTLRKGSHVQIDFAVAMLPRPWPDRVVGALLLLVACPVMSMLGWVATRRAWTSFIKGETELVSIWQPVVWPFQTAIAVGLVALALQCFAEGLRGLAGRSHG